MGRVNPSVRQLLERSNRLGADPRNTNYAGGNTSAKGTEVDPATGSLIELLWVKGSGGDLGTLTESSLAVLRMDRLRSLVDVYPGAEREDEMVAAFDFCLHGRGGAAPSIDTAMHGLVDAPHVDHLHPDSGIAIATAADGEQLTKAIYGDQVVWVPWRRPGFQLGLDIAAIQLANPQAVGCILGGHGITAWGATSDEAETRSRWIIETAEAYIATHGEPSPFGDRIADRRPLPSAERRAKAAALAPHLRAIASQDHRVVGHFTDSDVVLNFLASEKVFALAALGTSCPDHFLRTKVKPLVLDLPASAPVEDYVARLSELHAQYRADYTAYYERHATVDSPAMRGADPAIILVPGVGMFSYGKDKQTARIAGEFYVNAINVMRGAEALSTYAPITESEKFRIEYWALEEAKLQRLPKPRRHAGRIALVTGAASGIGKAIAAQLAADGACVVIADLDLELAVAAAAELGSTDVAVGIAVDVTDGSRVRDAVNSTLLAFGGVDLVVNNAGLSISKPLLDTTEHDWDLQHDVMAKGSFLVAQSAAKAMIAQHLGGDIVYIVSKNALFAGPNNIAYSATKADQAHQVRLLAAELGEHGIRVNGINPDGVVRGSGIFASGWGAQRARGLWRARRRSRRVLCATDPSQARDTPRTRSECRRGNHVRRVQSHHGFARPGRRWCSRRVRPLTMAPRVFAAVDLGASSGRVMAGVVDGEHVSLEAVHRFPNGAKRSDGHLRWKFSALHQELRAGLARVPEAESIGVDTWGVDYGLLDAAGALLAEPIAYRDDRTAKITDQVEEVLPHQELYAINGLQFLPFNTLYQFVAEQRESLWKRASRAVLLPDLIAYWLTGELGTELTNASTTGLLNVSTRDWSTVVFDRLGIPHNLFPTLELPGTIRGRTASGTPVTSVASHDTASAVVAIPATSDRFAYIASGTWSLVGLELASPVLTEAARAANFTNEIGVDGRTRFLRNVSGLWLLQECLRAWQRDDLDDLLNAAARLPRGGPRIDVDDPGFVPPDRMPQRVAAATHQPSLTPVETVRCILDSLAAAYARTVQQAVALAGATVEVVHIVGGGSHNALLCQLTADATGLPVLAGPVEATALGNVLVQAQAHGAAPASLEAIRASLASSIELRRYLPA